MYIINPENMDGLFPCGRLIHDYLVEQEIFPIGSSNKEYYFLKSTKLEKALKDSPFYIKIYVWLEKNEWRKEG